MTPHSWQVRRDACQALAVLAASLQFRTLLPLEDQPQQADPVELVLTAALELLITQKSNVMQVLEDVRYDKNVAVRATAASAWAEFTALPDPPDAEDATPTGRADKVEASTGATTGKPSKASAKRSASGSSPSKNGRQRPAPPRFLRPQRCLVLSMTLVWWCLHLHHHQSLSLSLHRLQTPVRRMALTTARWPGSCSLMLKQAYNMMLANKTVTRGAVAARSPQLPAVRPRSLVVRRFKEGEQADTSEQGQKAPKNPLTGQPLTPVTNKDKEGYQATVLAGQSEDTSARIMGQLGGQDGRPFGEMQAYDGLGPEVINSRLAMLGFAVAAFWELTQGIDIFQQVDKYPLITIATFVTFTVASWIPFMQGQSYNVKSGPFTPALEVTLGRIAMIGFVGLILNEAYFQRPFFPHLF